MKAVLLVFGLSGVAALGGAAAKNLAAIEIVSRAVAQVKDVSGAVMQKVEDASGTAMQKVEALQTRADLRNDLEVEIETTESQIAAKCAS
ncbi:hypothetical protein NKH86_32280 [Mesorhizobium sp. M0913]|uniref:hypothetical protein n=1 Tax=Mesorhizobium sp. M0913 TaxID=2957026 RepID=UPI00333D0E55